MYQLLLQKFKKLKSELTWEINGRKENDYLRPTFYCLRLLKL